ncbi:MAG TPA: hypothetical protein VIP46_22050 [Pyrinomonadaceae bacterium]
MKTNQPMKVVRVAVPAYVHFGVTVPVGADEDEIKMAALDKLHATVNVDETHLLYADNSMLRPSHRRDPAKFIEVHVALGEDLVEPHQIVLVMEDEDPDGRTDGQATPLPEEAAA